jgi:hypothetical protein
MAKGRAGEAGRAGGGRGGRERPGELKGREKGKGMAEKGKRRGKL